MNQKFNSNEMTFNYLYQRSIFDTHYESPRGELQDNSNSENVAQPDMDNFMDITSYGDSNYVLMTSQAQTVDDIENRDELYIIEDSSKKKTFVINKKRGRGRQTDNIKEKIHKSSDFDNLHTKIQVHFLNFIISISNDALATVFGSHKFGNFKNIDYKIKKQVNYKICDKYKNSSISNILQNEISKKYKKFDKNINKEIINNASKQSIWLNNFFNLNYLKLFVYYYNDKNKIKKIPFMGQDIILSSKTKTFYDLLEKKNNKYLKNELIDTAKRAYFNGYDSLKLYFNTEKNEI